MVAIRRCIAAPFVAVGWLRKRLKALRKAIDDAIADTMEDLPDMLAEISRSYRPHSREESPEARYERFLKQWLARDRAMFGRRDLFCTYNMISLADFYREQRRFSEAEVWYERALAIMERELEPGNPRMSELYSKLGGFYRQCVRYANAERAYERAVASKAIQHGRLSPELLGDLRALTAMRLAEGKSAQARDSLLYELAVQEDMLGPAHADLSSTLGQLARLERELGKADEADRWQTQARLLDGLAITESALGLEHISLVRDLESLAACYRKHGKHDTAEALLRRVRLIRLADKVRGPEYPGILRDLRELADLYERRDEPGDKTVAFRLRARADALERSRRERSTTAGAKA